MTAELPALDPGRTALLAIDFQNDFCAPEGFFGQAGHDVGPCYEAALRAKSVIERVRPLGVQVIWTRSANPDPPPHNLKPARFRVPRDSEGFELGVGGTNCFMPGTWGHEIVPELQPDGSDLIVDKPRYNALYRTALEEELRGRGIDTLVMAGVTSNCCVDSTTRDAYMRDFDVLILSDCVSAFGNERDLHEASLKNLGLLFAVVATADEFVEALRRSGAREAAAV